MSGESPSISDPTAVAGLRKVLMGGYTSAQTRESLHAAGENLMPRPFQVPVVLRNLPQGTHLSTLIKLFLLGISTERDEAESAIAPLSLQSAASTGVVAIEPDTVRPQLTILPFRDLLLAFDLRGGNQSTADQVMSLAPASVMLADLVPRRPVKDTLDLGTGCGIQALLAAPHSRRVIATDGNPRALDFARFNALLNDVRNIEFRHGSWFEPVPDMLFDLIVCNPPFVISPDFEYLYRDADAPGDALSRALIEESPGHLAKRGCAFFMVSWILRAAEEWSAPLRRWVEGEGCDAWLIHNSTTDALSYAANELNATLQNDPDRYTEAFNRWADYYRNEGVEAIGYGAAIVRNRPGNNWIRADDLQGRQIEASGEFVSRLLYVEDYLSQMADRRELLSQHLVFTDRHRLEQVLRYREGGYVVRAAALQLEEGLRFRADMDPFSAHLLSRLDGSRSLEQAIIDAAEGMSADLTDEDFIHAGLTIAERMLRLGFLRSDFPSQPH